MPRAYSKCVLRSAIFGLLLFSFGSFLATQATTEFFKRDYAMSVRDQELLWVLPGLSCYVVTCAIALVMRNVATVNLPVSGVVILVANIGLLVGGSDLARTLDQYPWYYRYLWIIALAVACGAAAAWVTTTVGSRKEKRH